MKKLFFGIFALLLVNLIATQGFAQQNAAKMAGELAKIYNLDDDQSATMLKIQERKLRNLSEIEHLKGSDEKMYRHKRKAIYQSTDASIRRMLREDQMAIYKQRSNEWRVKKADKTAELKAQGKSLEEIEDALLDMEQ